ADELLVVRGCLRGVVLTCRRRGAVEHQRLELVPARTALRVDLGDGHLRALQDGVGTVGIGAGEGQRKTDLDELRLRRRLLRESDHSQYDAHERESDHQRMSFHGVLLLVGEWLPASLLCANRAINAPIPSSAVGLTVSYTRAGRVVKHPARPGER